MSARTRSFAEIAQRGQESVAAVVRVWADMAQASVKVITTGPSELLDGRKAVGYFFDVANQVLDGQRALLCALTSAGNGAGVAVATRSANSAVAEIATAEISAVAEVAKAPEVAERPKIAKAPEVGKAPQVVEEPKAVKAPEVAEKPKATKAPQAAEVAEKPKVVAKAPEVAKAAEVAEKPKVVAKAPEPAKTPATKASEPAKTHEPAKGPYGKGSHAPLADRSETPAGFPIKGNDGSKLYHVPGSPFYKRTVAEVWFASPEAAEAAGFQLPASQR